MPTRLKSILKSIAKLLLILAVPFFGLMYLFSYPFNCDESSDAVAYARSLSHQRLTKLFWDVEKASLDPAIPKSGLPRDNNDKYPAPFEDIKASRVSPKEEHIMLKGCFDNFVYLHFEGLTINKQYTPKRQIVLSWGEHVTAGSVVLWSEAEPEKAAATK